MGIIRGRGGRDRRPRTPAHPAAADDSAQLFDEAVARVDAALGAGWYEAGGDADHAALTLCRLRRARAGERGAAEHGDEAVREALAAVRPEAARWIASRAISYLDESGFPELVEQWFPDGAERATSSV